MKKQFVLTSLKLTLTMVFVLIIGSCSDDADYLMNDSEAVMEDATELIAAKPNPKAAAKEASGTFYYSSTTVCLGDELTVTFDNLYGVDSDCGNIQIQYSLNGGEWTQLGLGVANDGMFAVTFTPEEGTYSFRAHFAGNAGGCKDGFDNLDFQYNTFLNAVVVSICEEDCIESDSSTAYAGDSAGGTVTGPGGNNAWWFYFTIGDGSANVSETIWEGKNNAIGTVNYNAVSGMITLDFNGTWFLATSTNESVKWYSYAEGDLPVNGRPTPGQAPNKGTNTSFAAVSNHPYYAIHLDVAYCLE